MANLLQKASIVLTPTAYDNGKVLCAKPSEPPYGDFNFSRNSAATRVNAQGLVENVQILSSNLVSNGDFSQEGSELVTNGSFATDSDWTKQTSWSISGGSANYDFLSDSKYIRQTLLNGGFVAGKTYKINFEITSGTAYINVSSNASGLISLNTYSVGSYSIYVTPSISASDLLFYGRNTSGTAFSITNISVKEVGQNWNFSNVGGSFGWRIANDRAICDAEGVNNGRNINSSAALVNGKTYKLTLDILQSVDGMNVIIGGTTLPNELPTGTNLGYEYYIDASQHSGGLFSIYGGTSDLQEIDNISIIEITDDTNLPRINYEGFSYQDALGSELVTNGDFATDTDWLKGPGWSISGGKGVATNTSINSIYQNVLTLSKSYKASFTISSIENGSLKIGIGINFSQEFTEVGTYTYYGTPSNDGLLRITPSNGTNATIDNVSVKEVTGQEVVPDSGCGSWLWEPQTTQIVSYSELFSAAYWGNENVGTTPILETGFLAPDGTNNAFKISNANQDSFLYATTGGFNATTTRSIYARTVSGTGTAQLCSHNSNTNNTFTITEQWQRFELNATASAIGAEYFYAVDFRGSGTLSEIILWGANATNDQDYATSYIPSNGSQVTRNQDLCNNGGSLASINSTEGTLYFEGAALANDGTTRIISLSDGTTANRVNLFFDTTNTLRAFITGVPSIATAAVITDNNKVALKFKSGDISVWLNGTEVATSTSTISLSGLSNLSFNQVGSSPFFGKTKALAVWKEALSDQELADLTYPTPTDPTFTLDFDTIATDFTFARGSEATYVDAQGLIQSTNEIGPELVTNGNFSSDTDWLKGPGWSISGGIATLDVRYGGSSGLGSNTMSVTPGKTYKVVVNVISKSSGFRLYDSNGVIAYGLNVGENVFYRTVTSSSYQVTPLGLSGSTGSIDNVSVKEYITATNTPRLDYSTGAEAFLLEPQSTNLITQSELFSDASWTKQQITITQNATISPSGLIDASMISEDNTNNYHRIRRNISLSVDATLSIFAKKGTIDKFLLWSGSNGVGFDLTLGTINNVTSLNPPSSSSIKDFGNGWYRCSITDNSISAFEVFSLQDFSGFVYQGSSANNFYIWGAQLEEQSYATSYIPTSGTTVTRNQETCINATPEINSEEGVLYAEIERSEEQNLYRLLGIDDGTSNNYVKMGFENSRGGFWIRAVINGVTSISSDNALASNPNEFYKIAIRYKSGNSAIYINGTSVLTTTTTFSSGNFTALDFTHFNNNFPFFGNTKDVQVYTKALSDAELIKLTT